MNARNQLLKKLCTIGLITVLAGMITITVTTFLFYQVWDAYVWGMLILSLLGVTFGSGLLLNNQPQLAERVMVYLLVGVVILAIMAFGNNLPLLTCTFLIPLIMGVVLLEKTESLILIASTTFIAVVLILYVSLVAPDTAIKSLSPSLVILSNSIITVLLIPTISSLILIPTLDRKRAQERLSAQKKQLEVVLRSITDAVIAIDATGKPLLFNPVAENMLGMTLSEAEGKTLEQLLPVNYGETTIGAYVARVLKSGRHMSFENKIFLSGQERMLSGSISPTRDSANQIIGAVVAFRDVTIRYLMDQELQKTGKLESLGVLAGGIAHDFNNILTVILGNIALASRLDGEESGEALEAAEKATNRATNLAQQLLTFARGGEPLRSNIQLEQMLREDGRFASHGSNVEVEFWFAPDLWGVVGDRGQLGQVIQNLVINAIQSQPSGGKVQIRGQNLILSEEMGLPLTAGKYVRISVQDWGSGIAPENLPKIFDPYFTTKQSGNGLGLAISYSIIRKHNGYIVVESERGKGATFHIYLPAVDNIVPDIVPNNEPIRSVRTGLRVLIMDDEAGIRRMVGRVLRHEGHTVAEASNGEEAIALYRQAQQAQQPFDVVLMDLTIPGGMGGKEAIQLLLEVDANARVIVSSGYSSDPVMAHYQEYGFKGMVAKPFNMKDLLRAIEAVMQVDSPSAQTELSASQ
ncbi:MAG: response regulator [Chloroflexi bacterium]|uniref:histidine kinase n=1 Tax=Candidatus Chlorohelix allophototropha TaxID=3003348 RepID=A0A8T7M8Z9_9CHLR|nr:response regulator [Chloroflexota bacterium]WJW68535.1 ATP-binding protein [Chloroflexota bacterium L227-S17]